MTAASAMQPAEEGDSRGSRLFAVDALRGLIMVLMALDHANYFVAQKYIEALQQIGSAPNNKLVLMPLEASGVIGSIAGITEIAREALGKQEST